MAEDKDSLSSWRLFHCFLRHGSSEEEHARAKDTWKWITENILTLRKLWRTDEWFDLLEVLFSCGQINQTLPSYELVVEQAEVTEKNEGILSLLKDYLEKRELHKFKIFEVADLPAVLREASDDWERDRLVNIAKVTVKIATGGMTIKDEKYKGARDALGWLLKRVEEGVLIDSSQANRPIVVQQEAKEIVDYYHDSLNKRFLPTGFNEFQLEHKNFLGILGYAGEGKSTTGRYIVYNMAKGGFPGIHISLENDPVIERNKYILLHAHDPEFFPDPAYQSLTYEKFKKKLLSDDDVELLREVSESFEKNIGGNIIIVAPGQASWESIKVMITQYNLGEKLHWAFLDYIQLLDPTGKNSEDQRTKMTTMIKDVRQFGLVFDDKRGLTVISPVQSNEEGLKKAGENEGKWTLSGINNDKELGRSMDFIIGVFTKNKSIDGIDLTYSCVKERDGIGFNAFTRTMSGCGWMNEGLGGGVVTSEGIITAEDIIGGDQLD